MHSHYVYSALKNDHWIATSVCLSFCILHIYTRRKEKFFELVEARTSRALQYYVSLQQAVVSSSTTKVADHEAKEKGSKET
jgi:hypothetical protein